MNLSSFRTLALSALLLASSTLMGETLKMATTTSTDNTGLLEVLAPAFKKSSSHELHWVATGTGKALKLGENCDVDVVMVHAPALEEKFVASGFGVDRVGVMYNDFVLVGPDEAKGKLYGQPIPEAMKLIVSEGMGFMSRGDNSGTHARELSLWKKAGIDPTKEKLYFETGQGMLQTLQVAAEKKAISLTDRGTYIKYESTHKGQPPLVIVNEGEEALLNPYSVIPINPKHCSNVNHPLAKEFADWIIQEEAQNLIGDFKLLGKALFTPQVVKY